MTKLALRTTKAEFETEDVVRERGKYRQVVIELHPHFATARLKGTRKTFPIAYDAIYCAAARIAARQERADKLLKKKVRQSK